MQITRSKMGSVAASFAVIAMIAGCRSGDTQTTASNSRDQERTNAAGSSEMTTSPSPDASPSASPSPTMSPVPDAGSTFNGGDLMTASPSPEASSSPVAANSTGTQNGLTEKYVIKVTPNALAPGEFTVILNDEEIGSFNTRANQDITGLVKPGKNVAVIRYAASAPIKNPFSDTTLTIGVQRNGTWSTVANQAIRKDSQKGEKKFVFVAK